MRLMQHAAIDVLQADATRYGGITGFLQVAALCDTLGTPLSAHTAPSLHTPLGGAAPTLRHLEYFHDHVRIEQMLFDGRAGAGRGRAGSGRPRASGARTGPETTGCGALPRRLN
jgi:L-alanine-DL-glutamate epimerase-like enolase superfamily enzyme